MLLQLEVQPIALPEGTRQIRTRSCSKCNQKIYQTRIMKKGVFVTISPNHVCEDGKVDEHSQYPEDSFFDEENYAKEDR